MLALATQGGNPRRGLKPNNRTVIQKRLCAFHDESQGQARFSNAFQRAHRGTCWICTPERLVFTLDHKRVDVSLAGLTLH